MNGKQLLWISLQVWLIPAVLSFAQNATQPASPDSSLLDGAHRGNLSEVLSALRSGANINARWDDGTTALWQAVGRGDSNMVESLLKWNPDPNLSQDGCRRTPLMTLHGGSTDATIAKLLLDHGAKLEEKDRDGLTALSYAAISGRRGVAELLVNRGADVNARDKSGATLLGFAKKYNQQEIMQLLKSRGGVE